MCEEMTFEVYTDGSGTTAGKPGGYAYVIVLDGRKIAEGSGHIVDATNNVAEVTAAIRGLCALRQLPEYSSIQSRSEEVVLGVKNTGPDTGATVVLVSDSMLVLGYANGSYQCRKPHLLPLYMELRKNYKAVNATTRWVKGHNGDTYNELCDRLAKAARNVP